MDYVNNLVKSEESIYYLFKNLKKALNVCVI